MSIFFFVRRLIKPNIVYKDTTGMSNHMIMVLLPYFSYVCNGVSHNPDTGPTSFYVMLIMLIHNDYGLYR